MSDAVSEVALPDDRRLGFNVQFHLGDTWYSSGPTVAMDPIEYAIAICIQALRGSYVRMPSAQVPCVADDKFDVLRDEIDSVSRLNQPRTGSTRKARIDFNDDWAPLRPPEFNCGWPPAKTESSQTAQRNICDTPMLVTSQRGRAGQMTEDKIRWRAEVAALNSNDLISHYVNAIEWPSCEFFDEYPRRRPPYVFPVQQIGRMFGQLIDVAAQSDSAAAATYGWLKNHRQADLCGSAFYVYRIRRQPISRYWNAGLLEELTLREFVAASFNRCGVRSR
ncbi:Uncharacterized protein MLTONO_5361 [Mesorhizobium loti]|nr:Uncharacterized protein MLTONO_5361 [Mesorhizobium loti]